MRLPDAGSNPLHEQWNLDYLYQLMIGKTHAQAIERVAYLFPRHSTAEIETALSAPL